MLEEDHIWVTIVFAIASVFFISQIWVHSDTLFDNNQTDAAMMDMTQKTEDIKSEYLKSEYTEENMVKDTVDNIVIDTFVEKRRDTNRYANGAVCDINTDNLAESSENTNSEICENNNDNTVMSESDKQALYRIVQAEAGGEDEKGKQMVTNVIMNRTKSEDFPDSVQDVIFQKEGSIVQFAPTVDGRYESVVITNETKEAVDEALIQPDNSNGALYFVALNSVPEETREWFEDSLTEVSNHGGHTFYR